MPVPMMQVGHVRVLVDQRFVLMDVRMRLARRIAGTVCVLVMRVGNAGTRNMLGVVDLALLSTFERHLASAGVRAPTRTR